MIATDHNISVQGGTCDNQAAWAKKYEHTVPKRRPCRWMIPGLLPFIWSLVIMKVLSAYLDKLKLYEIMSGQNERTGMMILQTDCIATHAF